MSSTSDSSGPADDDGIVAPWDEEGWKRRHLDRIFEGDALDLIIQAERGPKWLNPILFYDRTSSVTYGALRHNPYLNLIGSAFILIMGVFLATKLWQTPVLLVLSSVFFGGIALFVDTLSVLQIPSWHRARKAVKEYCERTGTPWPSELDIIG